MDPHKRTKVAIGLVFFFLGLGTVGYVVIAGYSVLDAFYMKVITISTVGYGEIEQLSGTGRLFTIFLILSGVGSIAFMVGASTGLEGYDLIQKESPDGVIVDACLQDMPGTVFC